MSLSSLMRTVAKIDPEKEYENAKIIIKNAGNYFFNDQTLISLDTSIDNLIATTRILIEREERRRGKKKIPKESAPKGRKKGDPRRESIKVPSQRYPNIEVREDIIFPKKAPKCPCCHGVMKESGLYDVTEKLEIIPKQYYIQRNKRPKFNCGHCHGSIVNTPSLPSIVPLSNYGDSFIIDITLSKFCDLIPVERYAQIAFRNGIKGLPPQSLIGLTHHLADFLHPIYLKIKDEVLTTTILSADETTHKMLEGDEISNWYLWGFFSRTSHYFETHNTRSGDIVFNFLKESSTKILLTDGYNAYSRARKDIKKEFSRDIISAFCNAHAFRYFKEASITWETESAPFLKIYGKIYKLEEKVKKKSNISLKENIKIREEMIGLFHKLKIKCEETLVSSMPESSFQKAINYFLNHYDGLVLCTKNVNIPLDNNHSERALRAPVVGRKTWYGTHSKKGAATTAIHFSIISSCKLNNINPRSYYAWVVNRILTGEEGLTPYRYSKTKEIR